MTFRIPATSYFLPCVTYSWHLDSESVETELQENMLSFVKKSTSDTTRRGRGRSRMILYTCATKHFQNKYLTLKRVGSFYKIRLWNNFFTQFWSLNISPQNNFYLELKLHLLIKHDPITEKKIVHTLISEIWWFWTPSSGFPYTKNYNVIKNFSAKTITEVRSRIFNV